MRIGKREVSMTESAQQQRQQQQLSSEQRLTRAGTAIREVENWMELNYPQHGRAIQMLREAGDLVTEEIQRMLQQRRA
jgi:hypothetical protein